MRRPRTKARRTPVEIREARSGKRAEARSGPAQDVPHRRRRLGRCHNWGRRRALRKTRGGESRRLRLFSAAGACGVPAHDRAVLRHLSGGLPTRCTSRPSSDTINLVKRRGYGDKANRGVLWRERRTSAGHRHCGGSRTVRRRGPDWGGDSHTRLGTCLRRPASDAVWGVDDEIRTVTPAFLPDKDRPASRGRRDLAGRGGEDRHLCRGG